MRYIADSNGYLKEVSFGASIVCEGEACKEYTGEIPGGYSSLEAWFAAECENLYQWMIDADGNLECDSSADAPEDPGVLIVDSGEATIPFYTSGSGRVTVQFNRTFPTPPCVMVSNVFNTKPIVVLNDAVTETQFEAFG